MLRAAAARIDRLEPAWLLSLGLAGTAFSGNWDHMNLPPIDRALLWAGIGLVVLRGARGPTCRRCGSGRSTS